MAASRKKPLLKPMRQFPDSKERTMKKRRTKITGGEHGQAIDHK
jgi:hypothetical protein